MTSEISPKSPNFTSLNDEVKNLTQSKHWGGILFVKKDGSLGELNFFQGVLEIFKGKLGFGQNRTKDVKEVFSNLILKHIEELQDLDQKSDQELVEKIIDLAKKADLIQSSQKSKPDMLLNEVVREALKNGDEKLRAQLHEELEDRSFYKATYPATDHPFKLSNPFTKEKQRNDEDVDQSPGKNSQTSHEENEKPPSKDEKTPKQPILEPISQTKEKPPIPDLPKLEAIPAPAILKVNHDSTTKDVKPHVASEPEKKSLKQNTPLKSKTIEPLDVKLDHENNQWSSLKTVAAVGLGTVFSLGLAYFLKQPASPGIPPTNESNEVFLPPKIIHSEIAQNISNFYDEPCEAPTHWNYLDITKIKHDLPVSNSLPPINSSIVTEQCLLTEAPPSLSDTALSKPVVNDNIIDLPNTPPNVSSEEQSQNHLFTEAKSLLTDAPSNPPDLTFSKPSPADENVIEVTTQADVPSNVVDEEEPQKDLFNVDEKPLPKENSENLSTDEDKIIFYRKPTSENSEDASDQISGSASSPTPSSSPSPIPSTSYSSSDQNNAQASFIDDFVLPFFKILGLGAAAIAAKNAINANSDNTSSPFPDNTSSPFPKATSSVTETSPSQTKPAIIKTDAYVDVNTPDAFVLGKLKENVEKTVPAEDAKSESPISKINFNGPKNPCDPDEFYYDKIPYLLGKSPSQLTLKDGSPIPCQEGDLLVPFILKTKISDRSEKETGFLPAENDTKIFLPLLFLYRNNHIPLHGSNTNQSEIKQTIFLKYEDRQIELNLKDNDPFYNSTQLSITNSNLIVNMERKHYEGGKGAPSAPVPEFESVKREYLPPSSVVRQERELKVREEYLKEIQNRLKDDSNLEEFYYKGKNSIEDTSKEVNLRDYLKELDIADIRIYDLKKPYFNKPSIASRQLQLSPSEGFATQIHLCVTDNSLILIEKIEPSNYYTINGERVRIGSEAKLISSNLPKAYVTFIPLKEIEIDASKIKSFLKVNNTLEALNQIPLTPNQENPAPAPGLSDKPSQETNKGKTEQPTNVPPVPSRRLSNTNIQAPSPSNAIAAQKFNEAERKHFETSLTGFFEIFKDANVGKSVKFIERFKTESQLPKDFWLFSKSLESAIPYQNLECGVQEAEMAGPPVKGYSVNKQQLQEFKGRIELSIESLDSLLIENTQLFSEHSPLSEVFHKLMRTFENLTLSAETYLEHASSSPNKTIILPSDEYDFLKLPIALREELFKALMQIEKPRLLEFYAHLAVITLNGGNDKSKTVTQGLDKWRQYMLERDKSTYWQEGSPGIPGKVYVDLLKSFFPIKAISDIDDYISYIDKDDERFVQIGFIKGEGDHNKQDGYTGHFTCDLQTDKGLYNLDSRGSSKRHLNNELKFVEFNDVDVLIPKSLYDSKPKISLKNLSVPRQNNNNCFLSAAWLQFCAFLHYYHAALEPGQIEPKPQTNAALEIKPIETQTDFNKPQWPALPPANDS